MADTAARDTAALVTASLPPKVPNYYEVSGDGITVTSSTTSFFGGPHFHYQDKNIDKRSAELKSTSRKIRCSEPPSALSSARLSIPARPRSRC
jgi:hypothetical protein